jgi:hypothetical protein
MPLLAALPLSVVEVVRAVQAVAEVEAVVADASKPVA